MSRRLRAPRATLVLAVVALASAAFMLNASSAPAGGNKNYSAVISPSSAAGASPTSFTVTIRNCGSGSPAPCNAGTVSTQSLGSANVTFPAGFSSLSVQSVSPPPGKVWTAAISGNVVQLRNSGSNTTYALAPGQAVVVTVKATTPSGCASYPVTTQAKQSNDFSGAPGNDFSLVGSQPSVAVSGTLGSFVLASIATPQVAGTKFTVSATAKDTCGNVMTTYPGGATLSGNIATSPGNNAPAYGPFSWSGGVGAADVYAYATTSFSGGSYQPDFSVTVTDGGVSKTSNAFAVTPGPLGSFTVGSISSPQTAGLAFTVNATAYDLYGNLKRDYGGGATLTGTIAMLRTAPSRSTEASAPGRTAARATRA